MNRTGRVILVTFIESFATICVERGVYFYTADLLGFSRAMNLAMALAFGLAYVMGALVSHRFAKRFGEKRLLMAVLAGQLLVHLAMAGWGVGVMVFAGSMLLGLLNGLKWPVIESYVAAGRTPQQAARSIGMFNISWATSIPVALVLVGPLIEWLPWGLFAMPAAINLAAMVLCMALPARPHHLPDDHPDRLGEQHLPRLKSIVTASRSLLLAVYACLWIMAAVMPHIFNNMNLSVTGPALSSLLDVCRLAAFVTLWLWTGWHGRIWLLAVSLFTMPAGFFMVLFGGDLTTVLTGEVLFGLSSGAVYYSALYHTMVVEAGSVDAGGGHESLIGSGFALGPAAGLLGIGLASAFGSEVLGQLAGIGPVLIVCSGVSVWAMIKTMAHSRRHGSFGSDGLRS